MKRLLRTALPLAALAASAPLHAADKPADLAPLERIPGTKPRNIVLILTDDHRYDAMGFMGHPFLRTPHLDSLARNGAHVKNAFVTTSLCSPSRASILTGQYAHRHRVVDNSHPIPPGTTFFPQYLQQAGYATAFVGKWHMGHEGDDPQPGFDHWVSFRGQGTYRPNPSGLNVDGNRVPQKGYITDELTEYALDWLNTVPKEKPFFLYLSHKAVHSEFVPADRHRGRYDNAPFPRPATMDPAPNDPGKPMWAKDQRNSWHGVDFPYYSFEGNETLANLYRRYCETLLAVDDSVGRVVEQLRKNGQLDSTLILYMGDNGFMWGEHGLIDKRVAYDTSIRVPMLMQCPDLIKGNSVVEPVVANIDVAPTLLAAAGLKAPANMDGGNFLPLAQGKSQPWRDALLYEYYWERAFPQSPTVFALRGDRYKYIRYHGIWDTDELYDLIDDPNETKNLIRDPAHAGRVTAMARQLDEMLETTGGMSIPLQPYVSFQADKRREDGPTRAEFPPTMLREPREAQ